MSPERRLAAILSADAVGYGRLMAGDEAATVRTITAYREEISRLVRRHDRRVVDAPGDNLLAEFPTATGAVQCALEIQRVLSARNAELEGDQRMAFRIGIHLGELRAQDERIYGDSVNIAARLESLAQPGGICISGEVHAQTRAKLDLDYEDLGEQAVKNIPEPVRVFRVRTDAEAAKHPRLSRRGLALGGGVLALAVALVISVPRQEEELTVPGFGGRPAIAVLPFDNLSGDPEQEYFADGIAEDLITRLSLWRSFPVISRNSSFVYKGRVVDVKQVHKELGVRYVVEGSVRRSGGRVRISAQLIDAPSGHHVWAHTSDRELADVFALQDEISAAIAASMLGEVERAEGERALRRDPASLEAWDLYQRAQWHSRRLTPEDSAKARELLEQALELDPYFASAYGRIAGTHFWDIILGWTDSPQRSLEELFRNARKSVELDPRSPLGLGALACAFSLSGEGEKMLDAARRAVDLNPSSPEALSTLGWALAGSGQLEEAIEVCQQSLRLSPHGPWVWLSLDTLAFAYLVAGRYPEAIDTGRRLSDLRPDYFWGYLYLAASFAGLDRPEEARKALGEALRVQPDLSSDLIRRTLAFGDRAIVDRFVAKLRKAGFEG